MADRYVADMLFFGRSVTFVLGGIALGYGVLTFAFGADLWHGPSPVYGTALSVPYAPQSWGVVAAVAGFCVIAGQWTGAHRVIVAAAMIMIVWFLFFAGSFALDIAESGQPFGAPGVLVYSALCLLMVLRAIVRIPGRL